MGKTILVVDDSKLLRKMVRETLEEVGLAVLEAQDGVEGLRIAQESRVDLFLIDHVMPEMSGIEVVRQLRKSPTYEMTPMFMLSMRGDGGLVAEGAAAGSDAWIVKPFVAESLIKAVQAALER